MAPTLVILVLTCVARIGSSFRTSADGQAMMSAPEPIVFNKAEMPVAIYLESGFLFNPQVVHPGEAVVLHNSQTGPRQSYSIVALVGDEASLPELDALLNFTGMAAVPAAYVSGLMSNLAVASVDIADGMAGAGGAQNVAESLVKSTPKVFMNKIRHISPGVNYFEVVGGPSKETTTDLRINQLPIDHPSFKFKAVKQCWPLISKGNVTSAAFTIESCGDNRLLGSWRKIGEKRGRPKYGLVTDKRSIIEWSDKRKAWRAFYENSVFKFKRKTLYQSTLDSDTMPGSGWERVSGDLPVPDVETLTASEDEI